MSPIGTVPERLNLSIGHSCFVACRGCYNMFGARPANLARFEATAAAFVRAGLRAVTLSGGDPLAVPGILAFVRALRAAGMESIKIDTVGTAVWPRRLLDLHQVTAAVDVLGVPLDGWDEESVSWFRRGRNALFAETIALLEMLETDRHSCNVYVNTVAHARNLYALDEVFDVIRRFRCVRRWNVFQYTATDQATPRTNAAMSIADEAFGETARSLAATLGESNGHCEVEWLSSTDRLGSYLLVNSDGDAWIPDALGRTIRLGNVFGAERQVLFAWQRAVERITCWPRQFAEVS